MCEDTTPIEALSFLQTDVSAVVDHANAKETETFRSLLAHLLSPSVVKASPSSVESMPQVKSSKPCTVGEDGSEVGLETEDRSLPHKRLRSQSPEPGSDQDIWTSKLDEDKMPPAMPGTLNVQALLEAEDPREKEVRTSSVAVDA